MNKPLFLLAVLAWSPVLAPQASACGPDFPFSYLGTDEVSIHRCFKDQLQKLGPKLFPELANPPAFPAGVSSSLDADVGSFGRWLQENRERLGVPSSGIKPLQDRYAEFAKASREGKPATFDSAPLPAAAVAEFTLYLDGTRELHAHPGSFEVPRAWTALLELPEAQRRQRTVWVRYMLGNLYAQQSGVAGAPHQADGTELAHREYAEVRRLAAAGFPDALGLAASSFKKDYQAEARQDLARQLEWGLKAVSYYAGQGKPLEKQADFMVADLAYQCQHVEGEALSMVVMKNRAAAEVYLAWCVSERAGSDPKRLLDAVKMSSAATLLEAENLAFLAYRNGDVALARDWLGKTSFDSLVGTWVRAELARQEGDLVGAASFYRHWLDLYAKAKRSTDLVIPNSWSTRFPEHVEGLLGRVEVERRDFLEALHCFMLAGSQGDAAEVAESYLKTDELVGYVDAMAGTAAVKVMAESDVRDPETQKYYESQYGAMASAMAPGMPWLRYLLARRLMREGLYDQALAYMPDPMKDEAARLVRHLRAAADPKLTADVRALAWFNAGRLCRHRGMELMGTAGEPDWQLYDGQYVLGPSGQGPVLRGAQIHRLPTVSPYRFHYRDHAANCMWQAATTATNPDLKAMAWYFGGRYYTRRDKPEQAQRFYRQLALFKQGPISARVFEERWLVDLDSPQLGKMLDGWEEIPTLEEFQAQMQVVNLEVQAHVR